MAVPEAPESPRAVVVIDLPGLQMEAVEENGGVSLANWRRAPSTHRQVAAVVAAVYEADFEEVRQLSLRDLAKYVTVSLDGDDGPGNASGRNGRSERPR